VSESWSEPLPYLIWYEPSYNSFRLYDIDFHEPLDTLIYSEKSVRVCMFTEKGYLQVDTDPLDEQYFIDFQKIHAYYYT